MGDDPLECSLRPILTRSSLISGFLPPRHPFIDVRSVQPRVGAGTGVSAGRSLLRRMTEPLEPNPFIFQGSSRLSQVLELASEVRSARKVRDI